MAFEGLFQLPLVVGGAGDEPGVSSARREAGEVRQRPVEEPGKPNALTPAGSTDAVHAVVPVTRAHEGESVVADGERPLEGAYAVVVERRARLGHYWGEEHLVVFRGQGLALEKTTRVRRVRRCRR